MKIGSARVSTEAQSLDIQLQALRKDGCEKLLQENVSGAVRARPQLQRLLDQLREGDTVVVCKLDRLARSTRDLLAIAEAIKQTGAGLRSLGEPWADTTSPAGTMVLTVFAGIGEFERALIVERTSTGRQAAKKRGVRFGRPSKLSAEKAALAARLIAEGRSAKEVADTFGVNRSTIYRTAAIGQALQTRPHHRPSLD